MSGAKNTAFLALCRVFLLLYQIFCLWKGGFFACIKLLFIFSGERILLRPSAIAQFVGTEADNNLALGIDVKVKLGCLHILQITGIILLCTLTFPKIMRQPSQK